METKRKQPKKPRIVRKPYLTGTPVDKKTLSEALKFFGCMIAMAMLFVVAGAVMMVENTFLRIVLNSAAMLLPYIMFYYNGMSKGTIAVNLGEMLHVRQENGRTIPADEQKLCYHPLKGFISALLGTIPFVVCAVILALTAQKQLTGLSSLPTWIASMSTREEIADPLAFYFAQSSISLESIVRMPVRMLLMPLVGMVGTENTEGLLLVERLSPILLLLPALAMGFGYTRGIDVRTQVHTSIAANNRKRAKRNKKKQSGLSLQPKQPKARPERKVNELN